MTMPSHSLMRSLFKTRQQNQSISGTWNISGKIFRTGGYDPINKTFNFTDFDNKVIINEDKESDYFTIFPLVDDGNSSLRPYSNFKPGLKIKDDSCDNKMKLLLPDYDDNGTFHFTEVQRNKNGEISRFDGIYLEAGYSNNNILQVPSVGKIKMEKQSNDDTITNVPKNIINNSVIFNSLKLRPDQIFYSIYNLYEELESNGSIYTIKFTGPVLGRNNKIVGMNESVNTYIAIEGITQCKTHTTWSIFETPENRDSNIYGKLNKYVPLKETIIKGSVSVDLTYQGSLSQSKFMTGLLETDVTLRTGDNLPQFIVPEILIIEGRVDGIRIVTCETLGFLLAN
jgi:hypothetical protein